MSLTVQTLAERIDAERRGDGSRVVKGCAGLEEAGETDVTFLANARYLRFVAQTRAAAVILSSKDAEQAGDRTVLVVSDPYFAFRQAMVVLHGFRRHPETRVSDQAVIDPTATVGPDCCIEPNVHIAPNVKIGRGCVFYPHCYVGAGTVIGDFCVFHPNVTIYETCVIGDRVTLHAGCVIGQDGFGYATHDGAHHKIPHVGNVVIENDVDVGANCAVDRATMGSTVIGAGTKLSDLVAIGHGTKVGRHNLLVAQVGIAGSAQTGDYVAMGGQVGVVGHIRVGSLNQFAGKTAIVQDVPDGPGLYGGIPAVPLPVALRNAKFSQKMPQFIQQVRQMERRIEELEKRVKDGGA